MPSRIWSTAPLGRATPAPPVGSTQGRGSASCPDASCRGGHGVLLLLLLLLVLLATLTSTSSCLMCEAPRSHIIPTQFSGKTQSRAETWQKPRPLKILCHDYRGACLKGREKRTRSLDVLVITYFPTTMEEHLTASHKTGYL